MFHHTFENHIQWQVEQLVREFRDQLGQWEMYREPNYIPTMVVRAQGHMSDDFQRMFKEILGPDWTVRFEQMRT